MYPSRHTWTSPAALTSFALAMLTLAIYGSLLPFEYTPRSFTSAALAFEHITLHNPADLGARGDWVVSVDLYLALSFLLMAAPCADRPKRRSLFLAPAVVLFCTALSVAIEFTQLYFPPRTVSLNDIVAESIGGLAGTCLWLFAGQRILAWVRRVTTPTGVAVLAGRLLTGYIALLLVVELMPFDFTVRPSELAAKFHEHKIWLVPFTRPPTEGLLAFVLKILVNLTCFFPLGLLPAIAAQTPGQPRTRTGWPRIVLLGLAAAALIELLQLLVYSRVYDSTDILTGTLGVLLGWCAGQYALDAWRAALSAADPFADPFAPTLLARPAVVIALGLTWFAAFLYLNWTPFDFTTDPTRFAGPDDFNTWGIRRMTWLPFVDYYWGSKYNALDLFLKKAVSFLPLGILCALAAPRLYRLRATLNTLALAFAAALIIELGRYFLPHHNASVTDLLLQCAGAWLGFRVTQHVRALLWAESTLYGYLYTQPAPRPRAYTTADYS